MKKFKMMNDVSVKLIENEDGCVDVKYSVKALPIELEDVLKVIDKDKKLFEHLPACMMRCTGKDKDGRFLYRSMTTYDMVRATVIDKKEVKFEIDESYDDAVSKETAAKMKSLVDRMNGSIEEVK